MGGRAASIVVVIALGVGVVAATAGGVDIGMPVSWSPRFTISPTKLSRTHPTHVTMLASGQYRTTDGSHVPALRELELEGDRHLAFDLKEVPVCSGGGRESRGRIEEDCRDALVGGGKVTIEISDPESRLMWVRGRLSLYNGGGTKDVRRLYAHADLPPRVRELVIPITIRKVDDERFGWRASAEVPKIAGGAGSIYGYSVRIGKRFLRATCADGRLELRATSTFVDGEKVTGRTVQTCSAAEPYVRRRSASSRN
jgi:hypothetical protein